MLLCGDNQVELTKLGDGTIDSVVTDPPYGISFMGKKWDYDVPSVELWKKVLRVLKPGGHALVACGTRTQHRMAVNLEDAGFEIRDIVAWIYGSGFPKSHNIGKAVDKLQGNEREDAGPNKYSGRRIESSGPENGDNCYGQYDIPQNETKGSSKHEGWGTALKPAMEPWTLCRKPLSEKTIATNVLKHGTGGINIDGCRVETEEKLQGSSTGRADIRGGNYGNYKGNKGEELGYYEQNSQGRFPANLIHDGSDEVVGRFPNTVPTSYATDRTVKGGMFGMPGHGTERIKDTTRSASRFFYCAKASKSERGKDNDHPTVKPLKLMRYLCRLITPKRGTVLDPFMGSGSTGIACKLEGFKFIGIEKEKDYVRIAEARIKSWVKEERLF